MPEATILVPLDGSQPSEVALTFLTALTPLADLRVRLLSVVDNRGGLSAEDEKRGVQNAGAYLDQAAARLEGLPGVRTEAVCRVGTPHAEILEEASRLDVNLVLMTTQGRSGVEPERLGGVADKVVRGAVCPVLLIGPHAAPPSRIERITVPLDASMLAAEALPVAGAFAERLNGRLRLVQAVQPLTSIESDSVGAFAAAAAEPAEQNAALYLSQAGQEAATGQPVETAVLEGAPAPALLRDLKDNRPDLVIMTSHGHTGFVRWALGSVTDRLIRGPAPVLVLRPVAEAGQRLAFLTARSDSAKGAR